MNITRYEPRRLFGNLTDDFNRLWAGRGTLPWLLQDVDFTSTEWQPAVDIKETDDHFEVRSDVPGVDPKDIEVSMENGMLKISGKRESEIKDEQDGYRRVEREYGEFHRQFLLPDSADPDKITAKCEKGVLEITIGKSPARMAKRIPVKS
jgi:HSP20 family protein